MKGLSLLWWALYTAIAICMQAWLPGPDFLLPGLIIAIQERKLSQFIWVALLFLLIQEGCGTMLFGSTLIIYVLTPALFYLGYSLFEVDSFPFIGLMGLVLSVVHYFSTSLMSSLQAIPFHADMMFDACLMQTFLMPFVWSIAKFSRRFCR